MGGGRVLRGHSWLPGLRGAWPHPPSTPATSRKFARHILVPKLGPRSESERPEQTTLGFSSGPALASLSDLVALSASKSLNSSSKTRVIIGPLPEASVKVTGNVGGLGQEPCSQPWAPESVRRVGPLPLCACEVAPHPPHRKATQPAWAQQALVAFTQDPPSIPWEPAASSFYPQTRGRGSPWALL